MEDHRSSKEPPDAAGAEPCVRAMGQRADALRVEGQLPAAGDLLDEARFLLDLHGGGSRRVRSELDGFEATLRCAQRRFGEAKRLLARVAITTAVDGENVAASHSLLSLALVYREAGELRRAIELTEELCGLIDRSEELASLRLYARHHLTRLLIEAGDAEETRRVLDETASLFDADAEPLAKLRRLWVQGHVDRAEGRAAAAEARYRAAWEGFLFEGKGYDAALVCLDLAILYVEGYRTGELRELAEEAVPRLETQDLLSEPLTAILMLRDTARAGRITLPYLRRLSDYLERARLDPAVPFEAPA